MATQFAEKAKEAFLDDDFKLAIDLYTKAIELDSSNADYFADRAQANIKVQNFTEAVADANRAIELDHSMVKAYLRKGNACIKLEEYQTAKAALETGVSYAQGDQRFSKLINECEQRIAEESKDLPNPATPNASLAATPNAPLAATPVSVSSHQTKAVSSVKPKYRHEYYQKAEEVVVTIFAKGVPAENVTVDFGEQILSVTVDVPGEEPYHFQPRLHGKIVPDKCRYQVLSTKIEIHLAKVEPINWTSLEYTMEVAVPQILHVASAGLQRPTYPSSKSKAIDWDKLEAQVKKEEKDEKLDGDAALNNFFRDIYQNADEDMRRAMSKSFVESNGTVLSTDWKEVGSKKIEGSAPDGMEMKKWEY